MKKRGTKDPEETLVDDSIKHILQKIQRSKSAKHSKSIDDMFMQFEHEQNQKCETLRSRLFDREIDSIPTFEPILTLVHANRQAVLGMCEELINIFDEYENAMNEMGILQFTRSNSKTRAQESRGRKDAESKGDRE
jgi:hypothetical protein